MDLTQLTLDDRCRLLGGATSWRTHVVDSADVPDVKMSDGPNGVRGEEQGGTMVRGVVVPVGIALGATWDPALVGEVASLLGTEARRKGVHVLLAPTVNLARLPIGGRVFECYSEDPELTARLAVSFVRGVQHHGVAVTVKHLVGNDTEIERMSVDVRMAESTLRELYLRPFEAAVTEAGAWGVMSAYNRLDGDHCAHNRWLLQDVLREEWGFDGFVVSDWGGAHDTVAAARAGLSLAMPGPTTIYGSELADAVRAGEVDDAAVDRLVGDLARLIERTGAAERPAAVEQESVDDPDERALCRRAATSSFVLLRNEQAALPLTPDVRIAVIGPNAAATRIMGGGSSSLRPLPHRSILDAVRDRFGDAVVAHAPGVSIDKLLPRLRKGSLRTPDGEPGLLVEWRNGTDPDAPVAARSTARSSAHHAFGSTPDGVDHDEFRMTLVGEIVPEHDGPHLVGALLTGAGTVTIGDTVLIADPDGKLPRGEWLFGHGCEEQTAVVELRVGEPVPVHLSTTGADGFGAITLGARPVEPRPLLPDAVEAARAADIAVVVVGTNEEWETEGVDRTTLALPGEQDRLVREVSAVAAKTVVVVNAGGPVLLPWADEVDAVLVASFAGLETGPAVAEVLAGDADPGGRLPVTYPQRLEDAPAWPHYRPVDGVQTYGEGRFIGHRGYEASGVAPHFPFGYGLSYGESTWSEPDVCVGERGATVRLTVTSTGTRPVTDVVQIYVTHPHPDMPPKTLAGFAKVTVPPGAAAGVEVAIDPVAWRRWDDAARCWVVDPGPREIVVAASATDERHRRPLEITSD